MVSAALVNNGAVIVHLGPIILQGLKHASLGAIASGKVLQVVNLRNLIYDIVLLIACVIELRRGMVRSLLITDWGG